MSAPIDAAFGTDRTSTGIEELDPLIAGGYPAKRAVLVCGGPGSGKTMLGLQFLMAGIARGEAGAFVTVDEKPRHVLEDARRVGWDLQPMMAEGRLALLDASPFFTATRDKSWHGFGAGSRLVASDLMRAVTKAGARRLVIDSLTSLVPPEMTQGAAHDYVRALVQSLEDALDCTIVLTCRGSRGDLQRTCQAGRYLASGVIELGSVRRATGRARVLRIRKMRGARVDLVDHPLSIETGVGLSLRHDAVERPRMMARTAVAG